MRGKLVKFLIIFTCSIASSLCDEESWSDDQEPEKWNKQAFETLNNLLNRDLNNNIAKNLIMFLGDGMGIR